MKLKSLLAAMFIVIFAAGMALAQDKKIDPYFQVRMFLGAHYADEDLGSGKSDFDYMENGMLTSRFGLKASVDKLSGQLEVGLKTNSYANALYLRHLYAKYKSDMGVEVLFGQTWTPYFALMGCQSEDFVGIGYGATYDGRLPQLRLTWKGVYIAAISPKGILNGGDSSTTTYYTYDDNDSGVVGDTTGVALDKQTIKVDNDNYMPKVAIGYEYKSDMLDIGPGFAINYTKTTTVDSLGAGPVVEKVTSFIGYVHGKVKADAFYTSFNATFALNPKNFGIYDTSIAPLDGNSVSVNTGLGTEDNDVYQFEGFVEFGYKLSLGTVSGGVGYVKNFEKVDEQRIAVYGQICIPVVKGFKVTPSVLYVNQLDDEGSELIAGVKLQADF